MAVNNAINLDDIGIVGYAGGGGIASFVGSLATQYAVQVGGATTSTLGNVSPSATSGVPLISQGSSSNPTFGTAVVAGGGTGAVTLTNHGVLIGKATSAIAATAAGSAGQVLQSGGASADPTYSTATFPATATGTGKVLVADGTNWVASTPTFPNASATAGKIIQSDGTNWLASTPTFPTTAGTTGKILISDGTNIVSSTPTYPNSAATVNNVITADGTNFVSSAPISKSQMVATVFDFVDDFMWSNTTSATNGIYGPWQNFVSSGGFDPTAVVSAGHPGIVRLGTASSSTGAAVLDMLNSVSAKSSCFTFGGGIATITWIFSLGALSNGTDRYSIRLGVGDGNGSGSPSRGAFVTYSDNVNSGNWVYTCTNGSTSTANSSTAVATGWQVIRIVCNAAASSVEFFAGTTIANLASLGSPITSQIPTAVNVGGLAGVFKSVGTGTVNLDLDLFSINVQFTAAR
jgi:hypothetical protein